MLKRILVGVDESDGARTALVWAAAVGEAAGAEVIVASTSDGGEPATGQRRPGAGGPDPYRRVVLRGDPRMALAGPATTRMPI